MIENSIITKLDKEMLYVHLLKKKKKIKNEGT